MAHIPFRAATLAAGVSALVACGGSSSDGDTTAPALSVTGTVATGAALAAGTVTARCATGTGTATTDSNGLYTLSIPAGALPCALEATGTSGGNAVSLHSVATGTTGHITPLTELLVAQVIGAAPSTLMSGDEASLSTTFSSSNVQTAQATVLALLEAAGVDGVASLASADLFAGTLTIGSSTGYDHVLDGLSAALATGGTTLAALTGTVISQSTTTTTATTSSLAPELLLKPASPSCASLRSGSYWMLNTAANGSTGDGGGGFSRHVVDVQAGTITQVSDGTLYTLTAISGDSCHYSIVADDSSTGEVVVSPAGVVIARGSQSRLLLIGIPQQSHSLAEIAGSWNTIGVDTFDNLDTAWVYDYGQYTVATDSGGTTSQFQEGCAQPAPGVAEECITLPQAASTLALAGDGGFLQSPTDGVWTDKLFAYHAGNGEWLALRSTCNISAISTCAGGIGDGSIGFATRTRTVALPTVGTASNSWNVYLDPATQLSTATTDTSATLITSIDATAGSFSRTAGQIGGATHAETLFINNPFDGFNFRDELAGVATSSGGTTTVHKSYFLKTGVGLSVLAQPVSASLPNGRLVLSVSQP
jgi:hypothetical protein